MASGFCSQGRKSEDRGGKGEEAEALVLRSRVGMKLQKALMAEDAAEALSSLAKRWPPILIENAFGVPVTLLRLTG